LGGLTEQLETATGCSIEVPSYAKQRKLLVCATGTNADQVLQATADLYGWELRSTGKSGRYRLDRPLLGPARDDRDLHIKIRRALPPCVHLWFTNHRVFPWHRAASYGAAAAPLFNQLRQSEKDGASRLPAVKLGRALEQRLANLIFDQAYDGPLTAFIANSQARPTLASPEQGWFTLRRGDRAEDIPVLMFHVKLAPGGRVDEWGWGVGSSGM